jgi:PAP2 superfamily
MRFLFVLGVSLLSFGSTAKPTSIHSDVVIQWNAVALQGVRDTKLSAPVVARALAIVHTCMYDAWAAYDNKAVGTQMQGALRRPVSERTLANKEKAISYAAYRALVDLLPSDTDSVYKPLMKQLGYDPNDSSADIETPAGIGNVACAAVLEFRHHDQSNQLGDLAQGPYSDWTHFRPINMPSPFPMRLPSIHPIDMNHWQPLIYVGATGDFTTQMFAAAQWGHVTPFAMSSGDEFRDAVKSQPPALYGSDEYRSQAEELVKLSAGLTDEQKMMAEYWSDGPDSESTPARWNAFAQWVSVRDHHSLDDDVKMFFALNNALLDASIAAWDMKREFDSVRPVTAIAVLFHGAKIRAWGGPGKGTVEMDGADWIPYQETSLPTPSSPEYVSGESAFSAAAASILASWTGNDQFGYSVTLSVGSSKIEPGITPAHPVVLTWQTFTYAADEAGMSRRYGGINFRRADVAGHMLGRLVAQKAWSRAQRYFDGTATPHINAETLMGQQIGSFPAK